MWESPKTDWKAEIIDGVYVGDKFNASDFNRIKNNILHLKGMVEALYGDFTLEDMGSDKSTSDYIYADEMNAIVDNLDALDIKTKDFGYISIQPFSPNQRTMTYIELNDIENTTLELYLYLKNQANNRRRFKWNFGIRGDF